MPWGDGTGPMGLGPRTGRGAGYCAGYGVPGYMNPGVGVAPRWGWRYGAGRGWGGWGWRNMYWATGLPGWYRAQTGTWAYGGAVGAVPSAVNPQSERQILQQQADLLQRQLDAIRKRLDELAKDQPR
ncbi:DUF5320 domain-containing protein [bacterium]|nr:DUF5320 domain-containing protein [bacterium]